MRTSECEGSIEILDSDILIIQMRRPKPKEVMHIWLLVAEQGLELPSLFLVLALVVPP